MMAACSPLTTSQTTAPEENHGIVTMQGLPGSTPLSSAHPARDSASPSAWPVEPVTPDLIQADDDRNQPAPSQLTFGGHTTPYTATSLETHCQQSPSYTLDQSYPASYHHLRQSSSESPPDMHPVTGYQSSIHTAEGSMSGWWPCSADYAAPTWPAVTAPRGFPGPLDQPGILYRPDARQVQQTGYAADGPLEDQEQPNPDCSTCAAFGTEMLHKHTETRNNRTAQHVQSDDVTGKVCLCGRPVTTISSNRRAGIRFPPLGG
ncbi:hypothetical protein BD414DRAFT_483608 [Trametes punicea]|nr:hypothetical protein BD414DRAFT_483608 [Trametes punicea]